MTIAIRYPENPRAKVLLSYHYWRNDDLDAKWADDVQIIADSGAFSARTQGAVIAIPEYAAWLDRWGHRLTAAANLDVIHEPAPSDANLAALAELGVPALPVFHSGEPWTWLEAMCEQHAYVALGGMVGTKAQIIQWLIHCFRIAERYDARFHGFGQTRWEVVSQLPFFSVDSTSWLAGGTYGHTWLWDDKAKRLFVVNSHRGLGRHGALIREQRGTTPAENLPGKAMHYRKRDDLNLRAWFRAEHYLSQRWGEVDMPRDPRHAPGPHVYMAASHGAAEYALFHAIETDARREEWTRG